MNWEGNGRVVARLLRPPGCDVHRVKVDEKVGILITTHMLGGLSVTHLFSGVLLWSLPRYYVRSYAHCEYENGYLVFDRFDGKKEVWRLASDFVDGEPEVAPYAPPDEKQKRTYEFFATIPIHQRYAPRGHFRPWAKLSFPTFTRAYRLAYPTLLCAGMDRAYLHDVRTGALVQTIDIRPDDICYVDVNEQYVFVCEPEALHVFSRADGGNEVLRIQRGVSFSKVLGPSTPIDRDPFVSVLPLQPGVDAHPPIFIAAHVSRDGRDLVIMTTRSHVFLVRDFERICRGETSIETSGSALHLSGQAECFYLAFEHGHICVATSLGLYIIDVDRDQGDLNDLAKVLFVQPFSGPAAVHSHDISCIQLTDRRVYFTWDDARRRLDVPLFKDEKIGLDLLSPKASSTAEQQLDDEPRDPVDLDFAGVSVGCIDFSLLPES